ADPAVDIVSIDYYVLKKQFKEALDCVERLDKAVGGDPYLFVLRANLLLESGQFTDAIAAVDKALKQEPKLEEAYWSRITIALKEKKHGDTSVWLKKAVEELNLTLNEEEMRNTPEYQPFLQSPEYREFRRWYEKRKK